jgi:hypothetical protein
MDIIIEQSADEVFVAVRSTPRTRAASKSEYAATPPRDALDTGHS